MFFFARRLCFRWSLSVPRRLPHMFLLADSRALIACLACSEWPVVCPPRSPAAPEDSVSSSCQVTPQVLIHVRVSYSLFVIVVKFLSRRTYPSLHSQRSPIVASTLSLLDIDRTFLRASWSFTP